MTDRFILALDAGTTSSRAIIFDHAGRVVVQCNREFPQHYPVPGWVEHDPDDIWRSVLDAARQVIDTAGLTAENIHAIGLTNQRETTVVWSRTTGKPVYPAIVWQDRRTAGYCEELRDAGWNEAVRRKTGLIVDPYFSATKLRWVLHNVEGAREGAEQGDLLFGTVDSFLLWRLTAGGIHITDYSNASRTMLFNIHERDWDDDLLRELGIPRHMLPEVKRSSEVYGWTDAAHFGREIPIAGCAGDQQAATFGQACFTSGMVKNTYGTGNFILMNTGEEPRDSRSGLLTTIAWGIGNRIVYALEGSIFITGAAVQWLRDGLQIVRRASDTEDLARQVPDTGGVYFVPAFTGLGAPYWDPYARGTLVGLTRGTGPPHIARAALEAVAYSSRDVLEAMQADAGLQIEEIRVDGGMVENDFLMQFGADITNARVRRPVVSETTALGAAFLAGLATGYWTDEGEIARTWAMDREFLPAMDQGRREALYRDWRRAVQRAGGWAGPRA